MNQIEFQYIQPFKPTQNAFKILAIWVGENLLFLILQLLKLEILLLNFTSFGGAYTTILFSIISFSKKKQIKIDIIKNVATIISIRDNFFSTKSISIHKILVLPITVRITVFNGFMCFTFRLSIDVSNSEWIRT